MTMGPIGPMSQQHADAEVDRVNERARMRGEGRTFGHDLLNAVHLVRRLARRARRLLLRR